MTVQQTAFDAAERRMWGGRADAYAGSFARLCAHTVPHLLDAAAVGAGTRVLDVGTGTGAVAAAACERGARVTAIDAEPGMVALARRAAPAAEVHTAVLPSLPFADGAFDAAVANFVLNHVGRPRDALAELRRVVRPGGRIGLTIWCAPGAPGQELLGRAMEAAGAVRPAHLAPLAAEDDFPRTPDGLTGLLDAAGLRGPTSSTLAWDHRAAPDEWWSGPAAGVASIGQLLVSQPAPVRAEARRHYDLLCREYLGDDGRLVLPHRALLATARR
ncbi:class I SAM-dependent methyltransferase [Streptacidiphilus jiangxiensis]|uniref:Methyltransferase domain-containing protein n=1 Tax=Streptacidiphilus jiangxiensis TaxID=235985 RepID=A0A1H7QQ63_STRJI|nr:class I SAM-dependent methyltransferase [Streptacidiphilus jiangxiensis]SEL50049.1 Methyltransferase domain-containing protein [Streptacidiphilus jiangxiensis]